MNWWLLFGIALMIFALLLARGMWVIGSGSSAETAARERMDSGTATAGWSFLDWLREAELPGVTWLESKLDGGDGDD